MRKLILIAALLIAACSPQAAQPTIEATIEPQTAPTTESPAAVEPTTAPAQEAATTAPEYFFRIRLRPSRQRTLPGSR